MKNIWLIANWKSNKNIAEALEWIDKVGPRLERRENLKIVVCPEFNVISEVKKAVLTGNFPLMVGSQDISPFGGGAYTGEEPASDLKDMVELAIIGHSERRKNFGETDALVAQKVKQAKETGILPLVCVQGEETPVPEGAELVAYEPIFAIGTGNPDTPESANHVAGKLKEKSGVSEVLYGGSVTSENVKKFISQPNLSGCLIGTASLDPEEFLRIIKACNGS